MQDWITDSHDAFRQTLKTATQLHAEEFMTCETCEQQPWFSFFFDGTGNNRIFDKPNKKQSNIVRLYEGHSEEMTMVRRFYYPGVGTAFDASDPGWWEKFVTARRLEMRAERDIKKWALLKTQWVMRLSGHAH